MERVTTMAFPARLSDRQSAEPIHPLVDLALLCAAGLFVSILLMTYGLDLSPGLF
jgi:hypothetical protein